MDYSWWRYWNLLPDKRLANRTKEVSSINIYSNKLLQKKYIPDWTRKPLSPNSNFHKMGINHKLWFCFFLWIFPATFAQQYRNNCFSRNAQSFVCHTINREENSALPADDVKIRSICGTDQIVWPETTLSPASHNVSP